MSAMPMGRDGRQPRIVSVQMRLTMGERTTAKSALT
jgi:hypothetical protein